MHMRNLSLSNKLGCESTMNECVTTCSFRDEVCDVVGQGVVGKEDLAKHLRHLDLQTPSHRGWLLIPSFWGKTVKGCGCALVQDNFRKFLTWLEEIWKPLQTSFKSGGHGHGLFSVFPKKLSNLTPKWLAGFWHSPYYGKGHGRSWEGQTNDCVLRCRC